MLTNQTQLKSPRIEVIDVLRGFTLFGIIIIHFIEQYYAGIIPQSVHQAHPSNVIDQIIQGFATIFIMGKFYMIFSFLFGLSFFIQFSKSDNSTSFILRFSWRLVVLLIIGMVHHLHYRGDILSIYSILGLGLLFCYRLPDKPLLVIALLLVFNVPSFFLRLIEGLSGAGGFPPQDEKQALEYYNTVKNGPYLEILKLNLISFIDKMQFQVFSGRIFITFGLFLLGIYAGRKKILDQIEVHLPLIKKLLHLSWKALIATFILAALIFGGAFILKVQFPDYINFSVGGLFYDLFNASMAMIYSAGIILLFQKRKWKKRLMIFYEPGRMGLTTYVMQSAFGVAIFFSYGLGLISELGASFSFLLAILLFGFQIVFSKIWFLYFNYGLLEWVWRSLTYFKVQPLLKKTSHGIASRQEIPTI